MSDGQCVMALVEHIRQEAGRVKFGEELEFLIKVNALWRGESSDLGSILNAQVPSSVYKEVLRMLLPRILCKSSLTDAVELRLPRCDVIRLNELLVLTGMDYHSEEEQQFYSGMNTVVGRLLVQTI